MISFSNKPTFYKPASKWRFFGALAAALALEAAAVVVASRHQTEPVILVGNFREPPPAEVVLTDLPPEPTLPPDQIPPPLPLPPIEPNEFMIEAPATPPPRREIRSTKPRAPLAARATKASSGRATLSSPQATMLSAPRPSYPYEARRARLTGSGQFHLRFNAAGEVVEVSVARSTGSDILDQVSRRALERWRCRPGLYEQVYVPITFTLQGAAL